jgi:diguanylate cyclase
LAQTIRDSLRDVDVVARIGGEEFAILLAVNDMDGVMHTLEATGMKICDNKFFKDEYELSLSVSIGVTLITRNDNLQTALKRADNSLYQAKKSGRNCIRIC